jgi:hypothetical protein
MSNPFFRLSNPNSCLSGLGSHLRLYRERPAPPSGSGPETVPDVVHLFVTEGSCYDSAGEQKPVDRHFRAIVGPGFFDDLEDPWVKTVMTLIHRGAQPVVDMSCCSWIDQHDLPERLAHFLEFVLSRNGTVRFSDFSLRVGLEFLKRIGMPFEASLHPDLSGKVAMSFVPEELRATGLMDLRVLADLGEAGSVAIEAMPSTRRMVVGSVPDYARVAIRLKETGDPALVLVQRPDRLGRVVLFSCHFSELTCVEGVKAERVASAIRMLRGEEAAQEFMSNVQRAQKVSQECYEEEVNNNVAQILSACPASSSPRG